MLHVKRILTGLILLLPLFASASGEIPEEKLRQGMEIQRAWHAQLAIRDAAEAEMERLHQEAVDLRAELCADGYEQKCPPKAFEIFVTSYNPEVAQTDGSPCGGAGGNVCDATNAGHRVLALSQDLVTEHFKYGDTVYLRSKNPACNGEFLLLDTMNKRWTKRGDLFFLSRKDNTSCDATVYDRPPTS